MLAALPEDTRLSLVPYTLNQAGLLQIWWGEATLLDDQGNLEWINGPEELVVTAIDDHQTGRPHLAAIPETIEYVTDPEERQRSCCCWRWACTGSSTRR